MKIYIKQGSKVVEVFNNFSDIDILKRQKRVILKIQDKYEETFEFEWALVLTKKVKDEIPICQESLTKNFQTSNEVPVHKNLNHVVNNTNNIQSSPQLKVTSNPNFTGTNKITTNVATTNRSTNRSSASFINQAQVETTARRPRDNYRFSGTKKEVDLRIYIYCHCGNKYLETLKHCPVCKG